jgi:predicted CXXCH cytochrome family protein
MSKVSAVGFVSLVILLVVIAYFGNKPSRGRITTNPPVVDAPSLPAPEVTMIKRRDDLPFPSQQGGFVSSQACRECHSNEFESWHDSFHRTMTQVATPEAVVAPFTGVRLSSRGRDCYLSQEGDKFYVTMADPDYEAAAAASNVNVDQLSPPIVKREIVMTTGSHHMQSYWVASSHKNMLRQIPWTFLIGDQRWVPREDIFLAPQDDPRHFAVWNDNCIVCHSVAGKPKFDLQSMKVNTEVAELGISCEACHGPGSPHIKFQQELKEKRTSPNDATAKDPIVNPAKATPRVSAEICGQCHAYFTPHDWDKFGINGYTYRAGGDLAASHNMMTFEKAKAQSPGGRTGMYWSDGTCRVAGREYTAMSNSPCFENGPMTCISCHSSHDSDPNDQLAAGMDTNEACLKCHEKFRTGLEKHTHHDPQSSGSLCYNCHMPHTSFGVLKAMRSHRVQVPRVLPSNQSDQPNGCNLCHLDKSLTWTAEKLAQWYDQPLAEPEQDHDLAAAIVWMLRGDAAQRSVAAWHMSWPPALAVAGDHWQAPFLAQLLDDEYAAVRFVAGKSLNKQLESAKLKYDYVAHPMDRIATQRQLLKWWNARPRPDGQYTKEILLDATGQLDVVKLNDLLKRQDRYRLVFPE